MTHEFNLERLDLAALALAGTTLQGQVPVGTLARLSQECGPTGADRPVHWLVQGEQRRDAAGQPQVWLHLQAQVEVPLTCQRCLAPADVRVVAERSFRFVASEEQAATEDEDAEEDVLALTPDFKLMSLVEDELLMAMPLVPRHDTCPGDVKLTIQDADFEVAQAAKPNPFAALAALRGPKQG